MPTATRSLRDAPIEELVAAAQADPSDNSAPMNEVVRRFQRSADRIAASLTGQRSIREDLSQAALMELVTAVRHHEGGRDGFTHYARLYMLGGASRELKVWIGEPGAESMSEPATMAKVEALVPPFVPPTFEPGSYIWGYGRAGCAVRLLPDSQIDLLSARYIEDATLAEIAAETGISVSAVSQRLATAHRSIAKLIA